MDYQERSRLARELMETPMMKEALKDIVKALHDTWEVTADKDQRDEIWYTLKGMERFISYMEYAMSEAEVAERIAEDFAKQKNSMFKFF